MNARRAISTVADRGATRVSRFAARFCLGILATCLCPPSGGASAGSDGATDVVTFRSLAAYGSGRVTLANGRLVSRSDWRSLFVAVLGEVALPSGGRRPITCSTSLVGEGLALMAAHCLEDGKGHLATAAKLDLGSMVIDMACDTSDAYAKAVPRGREPRSSDDFALCAFHPPASPPAVLRDVLFEVVDLGAAPAPGRSVLMTGFGCSTVSVTAGRPIESGFDGNLRAGDAKTSSPSPDPQGYVRIRSDPASQPALCSGDSGGPLLEGATTASQTGKRRIVAINSSSEADPVIGGWDMLSRMAPLSRPAFRTLAATVVARRGGYVCGIDRRAGEAECRD